MLTAAACVFGIAACASAPPTAELRIVVELAEPASDGAAIAREAARVARLPVRYLAAVSPSRHAMAIDCAGAEACAQALQRLRADTRRFAAVEIDARKARH